MSEKKIVVPRGMIEAVQKKYAGIATYELRLMLESALRWLSDNPIVPTDEQLDDLPGAGREYERELIVEWQRRMFLAVDHPEFPEEIRDLMPNLQEDIEVQKLYGFRIKEAYRRGLAAPEIEKFKEYRLQKLQKESNGTQ